MEMVGQVVKKPFAVGTKSEREGVFIATTQGEFLLRRQGGNPFYDPELVKLVGKKVVCEGQMLNEFTLCVRDAKVVP
jgi:hypothetical protein